MLVLAALGVGALLSRDDDDAEPVADDAGPTIEEPLEVPIEAIDGEPAPVEVVRTPVAITYRVEGFANEGGAVIDTERRWVRPPFESRVETTPGEDGEGAPTFLQIARFAEVQTGRESESPVILTVEPAVAPGVARVDVSALEWRGQGRTVLERTCEVYRAGGPIDVASLEPPTDETWADLCVDETGLVLHEEWVVGGEVFRRRIAVDVDESPSLDGPLFTMTGVRAEGDAGGLLVEVTADSRPADVAHFELASSPEGFTHRGRYGFTPPRGQTEVNQPEPPRVASILDVYEDGAGGFVVVDNGGTTDRRPLFQTDAGATRVDLGPELGTGEVVLGLRQAEVRVALDGGRFVRVWGTLPLRDLVALARTLVPVTDPNGAVTPID